MPTRAVLAGFDNVNLRTYTAIALANTSYVAHALSAGKRAVIRKIMWYNPGAQTILRVGYVNLGAAFVKVLPDIVLLAGLGDQIEPPICGNYAEGFRADATAATGTLGNIIVQTTGANNVEVTVEVEET